MTADYAQMRDDELETVRTKLTEAADRIDDLVEAEGLKFNQFRHQMILIRQHLDTCWEVLGRAGVYDSMASAEAAEEQYRRHLAKKGQK